MRQCDFKLWLASLATILLLGACGDKYGDDLRGLGSRVEILEAKLLEMNTDLETLSILIQQLNTDGYVTDLIKHEDGSYTIKFKDGTSARLRNGRVGRNGIDGTDGQEADLLIGVKKDTDGIWYWTINGEWILSDDGNKMRASAVDGKDGKDGRDGVDGKDGKDGRNGVDGVNGKDGHDGKDGKDDVNLSLPIPRMRITDDGIWEISSDNGDTWISTGVAANGKDGKNGTDGRADIFYSVTLTDDGKGLVLILSDSGETFTIPISEE